MKTYNERVSFRMIHTPCCHTLLCYVNPRLPNYCSECGARIYLKIKAHPECIVVSDDNAWLKYKEKEHDNREAKTSV
jgi:hypothetical protein